MQTAAYLFAPGFWHCLMLAVDVPCVSARIVGQIGRRLIDRSGDFSTPTPSCVFRMLDHTVNDIDEHAATNIKDPHTTRRVCHLGTSERCVSVRDDLVQ